MAQDRAPVVTAPATASVAPGTLVTITVFASDPDGDAITSFTAAPLPAGATFSANATNTAGTFQWTPPSCGSTATVTFTASNALSGSASTVISAYCTDRAPTVTAPATQNTCENRLLQFTVGAADPDGDAIASLTAAGTVITAGATFTVGAGNTSGTLSWTPTFTQAGAYGVTFTAQNALTGSASTTITVGNACDRAPVVTAPATATFCIGQPGSFIVTAADPDGEAITSLMASGTAITAGATFTAGAGNTSGTLSWTPAAGGSFNATFTASNTLTGSASTSIVVPVGGASPVVSAPQTVSGPEGSPIVFTVTASDPDGPSVASLTASGTAIAAGATFTASPSGCCGFSGTFDWTPDFTQAGTYSVTFTATNTSCPGSASTGITVTDCTRTPAISAPSHVAAAVNDPVSFTVGAATCGGEGLTLDATGLPPGASFSASADHRTGTFTWTPGSDQSGTWPVTFVATVDAGTLSGSATTVIDVAAPFEARAFTSNSNKTIRLSSSKAAWCVSIEPIGGSFDVDDVAAASVVLISPGTGSVSQISAHVGKSVAVGDADKNDIEDVSVCFQKEDLRLLFSNVNGRTTLDVTLAGDLTSGGEFHAMLSIEVIGSGGSLAASVTPNPLNPSGVLSFVSTRAGAASVRVFDHTGRLVRTLSEGTLPAGRHEVRIDGRDQGGRPLATGIYFYRVELAEGAATGRFTILK
jgi:hypothetical protein